MVEEGAFPRQVVVDCGPQRVSRDEGFECVLYATINRGYIVSRRNGFGWQAQLLLKVMNLSGGPGLQSAMFQLEGFKMRLRPGFFW